MKNKFLIMTISFILATASLIGCGSDASTSSAREKNAKQEDKRDSSDRKSAKKDSEDEEFENEDSNNTDLDNNADTTNLEDYFYNTLQEEVGDKTILQFSYLDYDNNGEYEAFAFVGSKNNGDEYMEDSYDGDLYFVNAKGVTLVKEGTMPYISTGYIADFGNRKYYTLNEIYATGYLTYIYSADYESYFEDDLSRIGDMSETNGDDFTIIISAYDGEYDKEMDTYLGHTWKVYYYHYSKAKDALVKYESEEISLDIAKDFLPEGMIDEILGEGYEIENIILRENDIININYHIQHENGNITYKNANYNISTNTFIEPWGEPVNNWQDSDFGGTYQL